MKSACSIAFVLLVSTAAALPSAHRDEPRTLVVASLDTARADAFIGNLRSSGARRIYAAGGASLAAAQRVGQAMDIPVASSTRLTGDLTKDAAAIAGEVRAGAGGVSVVLIDQALALAFLREITNQPRSSFPLSGSPGRMWVVTLAPDYTSVVRGRF